MKRIVHPPTNGSNTVRATPVAAVHRCKWAESDPLLREYHDIEWGVPQHDSRALWEMLTLESFQAGLSWLIVLRKRDALRAAFCQFNPTLVAKFDESDIARLMGDAGIIRSRSKIESTIAGARIYMDMKKAREDFAEWTWAFVGGQQLQNSGVVTASTDLSEHISKALKARGFKFVGPTIVYAWMQAVGLVNDHALDCFRRHAVHEQALARS